MRKTENRYWNPAGGVTLTHAADAPAIGLANAYWNAGANRKRDSLLETRIYAGDEGSATLAKALSQFQYDNPDTTGNVVHEYRWDNQLQASAPAVATTGVTLGIGVSAVTHREYNSGLLTKETDPSGNFTQYAYGQAPNCPVEISNLYPTLVTAPEGQARQYSYDCATGAVTDETVTYNQNLRTHNDYDRYGRVTSSVSGYGLAAPNTHTTTTEYDDSARQERVVSDGTMGRVSHFNQLGELYLDRENANDSSSAIVAGSAHDIRTVSVERTVASTATYSLSSNPFLSDGSATESTLGWTLRKLDRAGRVEEVSYYSGAAKPAPFGSNSARTGCESYSYGGDATTVTARSPQAGNPCASGAIISSRTTTVDALGRMKTASEGGLTSASYGSATMGTAPNTYQAPTTKISEPTRDQNNLRTNWRTMTMDGFGNLVAVLEPNPAGGTWSTSYLYNQFNQLTQVSMPRPTGTQTRTFVYDSAGRQTSVTQPETGTTTFGYDSLSRLSWKRDAKNQKTSYEYDVYHRLTRSRRYQRVNGVDVEDSRQFMEFSVSAP